MSIIERIKSDERVSDVSDERGIGDGFWVYLKQGWNNGSQEHIIHEDSPSKCYGLFALIEKCECWECRPMTKEQRARLQAKVSEVFGKGEA